MVRGTEKIVTVALIALLGAAMPQRASAAGTETPPGKDARGAVRLDEVRITGSPEHPGVLFFLPRTRFHLLPFRPDADGGDAPARDDRKPGAPAP